MLYSPRRTIPLDHPQFQAHVWTNQWAHTVGCKILEATGWTLDEAAGCWRIKTGPRLGDLLKIVEQELASGPSTALVLPIVLP